MKPQRTLTYVYPDGREVRFVGVGYCPLRRFPTRGVHEPLTLARGDALFWRVATPPESDTKEQYVMQVCAHCGTIYTTIEKAA